MPIATCILPSGELCCVGPSRQLLVLQPQLVARFNQTIADMSAVEWFAYRELFIEIAVQRCQNAIQLVGWKEATQ